MTMQYIGTGRLGPASGVAYTGTAGSSASMGSQTYKARVLCTTDAMVTTDGSDPSSTLGSANGAYCPAFSIEYFTVTPGQVVKAKQVSAGGSLYVVEIV